MYKARRIHALLFSLLLLSGAVAGDTSWGHNAVGIRAAPRPRQRSPRSAADTPNFVSVRTALSRRGDYGEPGDTFSVQDDNGDDELSIVDFCSAQSQDEPPTITVSTPNSVTRSGGTHHTRGGANILTTPHRPLVFWENMVCGAISRSIAQTVMHPANAMKTILQSYRGTAERPTIASLSKPGNFCTLTRGAGANFLLSVPHGAINFAVLELIRHELSELVERTPFLAKRAERIGPGLDFMSSAISTVCCSVVSTPQMMITDNIMAGNYPNMPQAVTGLWDSQGLTGFYRGWWPGLAGKIPSYALTWTLFQQLKAAHTRIFDRPPKDIENSILGCIASTTTVCIMIPMDTIKTRLVTQASMAARGVEFVPYKGIVDCAVRMAKEEGIRTFYRGLPPRLVSVVPMIGIQFGVYEFMKKVMLNRAHVEVPEEARDTYGIEQALGEAMMEVAADDEQPYPAPQFHDRYNRIRQKLKRVNGKGKKAKSK